MNDRHAASDVRTRVESLYGNQRFRDRLHVHGRLSTMPLDRLLGALTDARDVVDIGCGHGVVTMAVAMDRDDRTVLAVDPDQHKLDCCADALQMAEFDAVVRVEQVDAKWRPAADSCDAVVIADVLYLLDDAAARDLLGAAARAVRPGGVVVVAELNPEPRWRSWIARGQEFAACRVLGVTTGTFVSFRSPLDYTGWLEEAGLHSEWTDGGRHGVAPHFIVLGRR